jgi:hypothetical protein
MLLNRIIILVLALGFFSGIAYLVPVAKLGFCEKAKFFTGR